MPDKTPDVWKQIWILLSLHSNSIITGLSAILAVILRALFVKKKPLWRHTVLDAFICALIATTAEPLAQPFLQFFFHVQSEKASYFLGVMIGFIGTEKFREYLLRFLNQKVGGDDANNQ